MRGAQDMNGGGIKRGFIFLLCLGWFLVTLFPVYWTLITSFKPPTAVNGGPTYLPWIDFQPTVQAWVDAWSGLRGDFITPFVNSTLIAVSATALAVLLGSMAAYALVRFPFQVRLLAGLSFAVVAIGAFLLLGNVLGLKRLPALGGALVLALAVSMLLNRLRLPGPVLGNDDVVFWFVSQRMFPPIVTAFALYLLYSEVGKAGFPLLDSYWGMVLCYTAFSLPIVVWLMRDFFQALPVEIEEAALVDDVPRIRIFFEIVLPMARPGLIATAMITLSFVWNEFLFSLLLTAGSWQTLPILLSGQNSYRGDEWWAISVAAMVSIAPMMVMAVLLARLMRSGLLLGSIR
ncbi:multiple sugar transport system permease protein [Inquilinus ginsengisoli]|uniref:Multiple sugar transport system permease protein n=1 Tax=Inquilinus ginsengisoli TaxID=363840 RepID=A0ABU1JJY1_9PROT|nr:carbohydrate ABC transporter permease [Inquilinus ginsengisoli]MDR6288926.1 multiple sugar transport system permease protein [Inquilinus ginsengisoli]